MTIVKYVSKSECAQSPNKRPIRFYKNSNCYLLGSRRGDDLIFQNSRKGKERETAVHYPVRENSNEFGLNPIVQTISYYSPRKEHTFATN